jgi:hypothetical protein
VIVLGFASNISDLGGHRATPARPARRGFSMLDVLVTLSITTLLMAALMPALARSRGAGDKVACLWNLRQIGLGFCLYASDNQHRLPDPQATQRPWEYMLKKYTVPQTFNCLADQELFQSVGSSYDWRDTGKPETTLAGKHVQFVRRGDCVMAFEALPGWHQKAKINVVRVDTSTHTMDQDEFFAELAKPISADGR